MPSTALRRGAPVTTWFGSEVPPKATAHLRGEACHEPVGGSCDGVAAHDDQRHAQRYRRKRAGKARIAADGDHDPGSPPHDDRETEHARDEQAPGGAEVLAREPPLDAPTWQQGDIEARLGHEPGLHAAPRADVQDRRGLVAPVDQCLTDGQRGLHVPGRTAAGDESEDSRRAAPRKPGHRVTAAGWRLAIPNSSPTPIRATTKDEPP